MRVRGKVDANQKAIVAGLRRLGVSVYPTAALGGGFPDLCCGWKGKTFLLEVKDSGQPMSKRRLTPQELAFREGWRGQVAVVECLNDALTAMGITL